METMSGEKKKKKRRGAVSFHLIRFRVKGRSENEGRERGREGERERSGDESIIEWPADSFPLGV